MTTVKVDLDSVDVELYDSAETDFVNPNYPSSEDDEVNKEPRTDKMESSEIEVSIGLIGESQSGKTSFINALMGEKMAKPGVKTSKPKGYIHPKYQSVEIWDLPGLGSSEYPNKKIYCDQLNLEKYDAFLLFTNAKENLPTTCKHLVEWLESKKKPFLLIRTFIDEEVKSKKKKTKTENFNEEELKKEIRGELCKGITIKEGSFFFISNVEPKKWDFPALMTDFSGRFLTYVKSQSSQCSMTRATSSKMRDNLTKCYNLLEEKWNSMESKKKEPFNTRAESKREAIEKAGLEASLQLMEENLNRHTTVEINLAVIGRSGVGKSSFINAMRGIAQNDEKAAKVGVVETTMQENCYAYKDNPNVKLWDCPGSGTKSYAEDEDTYFRKITASKNNYNAFIILECDRFLSKSATLASKLKSNNIPVFLARTKIDQDRRNVEYVSGKKVDEVQLLKTIRAKCAKELKDPSCASDVFLISSYEPTKWEFSSLNEAVRDKLSIFERECFMFAMVNLSENILNEKIKILKDRVKYVSLISKVVKFFTWKSYWEKRNNKMIPEKIEFYRKQLGFPEIYSKEFKGLPDDRQREMKKFYLTPRPTAKNIECFLKQFDADCQSDDFISCSLNRILDEMGVIALKILKDASAKSGEAL